MSKQTQSANEQVNNEKLLNALLWCLDRLSIGNIVKWEISKLIGLDHSIFSLVCCRLCRVCIRHLETSLSFITSYESL